ncbi:MAG: hypothetical protein AB7K71_09145, partial [Polyangiaceae bacterium]
MAMLKNRARATALASVLPLTIVGFTACGSDPSTPGESVGSTEQAAIGVGSGTTCRVELTKVNYDEPGADSGNFVELHVIRDSGSTATTFGECGLGKVQHVNGGNSCASVWVVDVSAMTIPNDDYLVICGKDGIATSSSLCDVTVATSGSIGTDLLQSGPDDIYFFDTADNLILDARYENGSDCTNSATQIQLQAENGDSPDQTNVACNDAFMLVDTSTVTLRQAYACPVSDAGTDAAGGSGGSTGGTGGTGATGGSAGSAGSAATGGTGGTGAASTGGTGAASTGGTGAASTGGTGGTGATTGTGGSVGTGATGGTGATTGTGGSVGTGATGGTGATTGTG